MKFSENAYENISLDELVTYSLYILIQNQLDTTFENIVAKSFELFPKKFFLIGYPQWPDSARVNKAWLRCRTDFKYITGTVKSGFNLTSKGLEIVQKVQRRLNNPDLIAGNLGKKLKEERSREEAFINQIEKNRIFTDFAEKGDNVEISEFDFCDLIFCTLESSTDSRRKNLKLLKDYAKRLNKENILKFLSHCERVYTHYLGLSIKDIEDKSFKGGMFKQKKGQGEKNVRNKKTNNI